MIFLPSKYYLVVNDRFELFFRGVIKKHNPYQYYVKAECEKAILTIDILPLLQKKKI